MSYKNKIFSIVNDLHEYYALGTPNISNSYIGTNKIRQLTHEKIESITDGLVFKDWRRIIEVLNASHSPFKLEDLSHIQFPSFIAKINLVDRTDEFFTFNRSIIVSISLLAKYYTVYCMEIFKPIANVQGTPLLPTIYVRSVDSLPEETNLIKNIGAVIKDYSYVD